MNEYILIQNTPFVHITVDFLRAWDAFIELSHQSLTMIGPVMFKEIKLTNIAALFKLSKVIITLHRQIQILMFYAEAVFISDFTLIFYVALKPLTVFDVCHNIFQGKVIVIIAIFST